MLLVVAYDDDLGGEMVAAALNFVGDTALYGRNWGCRPGADYKVRHSFGDFLCCAQLCYHILVLLVRCSRACRPSPRGLCKTLTRYLGVLQRVT